ncbi:MAG: tetratricopeptide repeat protein [Bacillota bacterium]
MKDYYGTLNIPKSATVTDIKKAYFGLVRKYPPDRYPEAFMRIREAYEVLVDENTRRQYDEVDSMPADVKLYFDAGRQALDRGDAAEAIRLLEWVVKSHPHFSVVNSLLGEAYLKNENSGKAIRIFEELVAQQPNHAGFARQLAQAYAMRGWHKKGIEQYRRALSLDEDNLSLWLGLIDCHLAVKDFAQAVETVMEGLEVSNRKGWDNLELYYHMIQIDIYSQDHLNMRKHLEEMKNRAMQSDVDRGNVAWFLAYLSQRIHSLGLFEESAATIDAASALLPDDEEIAEIKKEIDVKTVILGELKKLEADHSINSLLAEMLDFELHMCGNKFCLECPITQFFFEAEIVAELATFRRDIARLKSAYPQLYNLKKEFFDLALNPKKEDYLFETCYKKYKRYKKLAPKMFESEDDEEEDEFFPQPYTRPGPKVGRNDPCPCGSGKKYKKCCGRS